MVGHCTRFQENLPPWRGSAEKKKPLFFNACALMAREIMSRRDVQYWGMTLTDSDFS